jgi:hypothetical protein
MQRLKNLLTPGAGIALTALLVFHAGPARAGGEGDEPVSGGVPVVEPDRKAQAPVAAQVMRVYRDPQTGRFGPPPPGVQPPALSAAERHMLNRSDSGLQSRTLPRGGVAVDLQGRFRNMAVARVGTDGKAAVNCTLTTKQAAAALQAGQQARNGSAD